MATPLVLMLQAYHGLNRRCLCVLTPRNPVCALRDITGLCWWWIYSPSVPVSASSSTQPSSHSCVFLFYSSSTCLCCFLLCGRVFTRGVSPRVCRWGRQRWNWSKGQSGTKQVSYCSCRKNCSDCWSESSQSCASERVQISPVQEEGQWGR